MKKFNSISVKLPFILNITTIIICAFIILSLLNSSIKEIYNYVNKYAESSANGYRNYLYKTIEDQILLVESTVFITLQKVLDNNVYITNAYILSDDSTVLTSYKGNDNKSGIKVSEIYNDLWNTFISKNYNTIIADTIYESDINNGYVLPMLCPIFGYNSNFLGAFIGFIDWSLIIKDSLQNFGNVFSSKDNTIFIINNNKEFVYHNIASEIKNKIDLNIPSGEDSGIVKYNYFNINKLAFFKKMKSMPWILVDGIAEDFIYSSPKKMFFNGTIIGLIGIIISVLFSIFYIRRTIKPIKSIVEEAKEISLGNLTICSNIEFRNDEIGELLNSFCTMRSKFSNMIKEILISSREITNAANELYQESEDLAKRTEYQASSLEETASSMEEMSSTIKSSAQNSINCNSVMMESKNTVLEGGSVIEDTAKMIEEVYEASSKIKDITKVIEGIAFQTNILALNASVEAARAGDRVNISK